MKSINLYSLTESISSDEIGDIYLRNLTDNPELKINKYEISSIKKMLNVLNLKYNFMSNFFYSYTIPQISKQFDLLQFSVDYVLNIEIKSQKVPIQDIEKQLCQNKYYLGHLGYLSIHLFTYIAEDDSCYCYEGDKLSQVNHSRIIEVLKTYKFVKVRNIDDFFHPSLYLVSPFNNTEKFLKKEYFLTSQQHEIKHDILNSLLDKSQRLFAISGQAGTGKSLLLYDLALALMDKMTVLIIHCGILNQGHKNLQEKLPKLKIIAAKEINEQIDYINKSDFILIDETQRIYLDNIKVIAKNRNENTKIAFFYDPKQKLSVDEKSRNIDKHVESIKKIKKYTLSKKIRTNKELHDFILSLFDLSIINKNCFQNVEIVYLSNERTLKDTLHSYESNGYKFIPFTPARKTFTKLDIIESGKENTHKVIGQEFDKVIMYMDDNFYYEGNFLTSKKHPNTDYLYAQLLLQGLTRAKFQICLLVINNELLLQKILSFMNTENQI